MMSAKTIVSGNAFQQPKYLKKNVDWKLKLTIFEWGLDYGTKVLDNEHGNMS